MLATILILGLALVFRGDSQQNQGKHSSGQQKNFKQAPPFELSDFHGKKYRLEDFKGKVVILHFWASWCKPCLDEIPQWVELGNVFKDKPVQLVAISLDSNWNEALKILPSDKLRANVVSLLDVAAETPEAYGTFQFPETYFISKDQQIITKRVGPQDWQSAEMVGWIEKFL